MVKEAEKFASEDKKRRDAVETKNQAETMVYQTEKQLKEFEGKVGLQGGGGSGRNGQRGGRGPWARRGHALGARQRGVGLTFLQACLLRPLFSRQGV